MIESKPVSAPPGKSTRNIEPQAPRAASAGWLPESALVSPVASKKNVSNPEPGRNCAFSGLLNGVAPAALAAALALNAVAPLTAVSWTVTQCVSHIVPG